MAAGGHSRATRLAEVLSLVLAQEPDLEACIVVSADGLPMASTLPPQLDETRVAAMSAALASLGERAAHGLGRGGLAQVLVEAEAGTVVLVAAGPSAVLVATAPTGVKSGLVLYELRRGAQAVAMILEDDDDTLDARELMGIPQVAAEPERALSVPASRPERVGTAPAGPSSAAVGVAQGWPPEMTPARRDPGATLESLRSKMEPARGGEVGGARQGGRAPSPEEAAHSHRQLPVPPGVPMPGRSGTRHTNVEGEQTWDS